MKQKTIDLDLEMSTNEGIGLKKTFINKVRELNIAEIEPLLTEDSNVFYSLKKYQFLIVLRDLFSEFKRLGDTQILIEKGTCGGERCSRVSSNVYQLKGNNSKQAIFFGIEEDSGNLKFHGCMHFVDQEGKKGENWHKLTWFAVKTQQRVEKSIQE